MTTDPENEMTERQSTSSAGGSAPPSELPDDIDALQQLVLEEREKAANYQRNWQRAAADYQNFKRRVEEERGETARFASAAFVINLLPLVDDLERALTNVDSHLANLTWVEGIRLIYRKFEALLEMTGLTEIAAEGQTFDPAVHEAVAQVPGEENKVVSVIQRGYRLGDRVLRPSMVIVGNGAAAPEADA